MRRLGIVAIAFFVVVPASARAHFKLVAPESLFVQQEPYGDPQKNPPCGPFGAGEPTNAVTAIKTGTTVTVTINETITHPGHYRISLAQDMAGLPPDPTVMPSQTDQCAAAVIDSSPTLPVLADGLLVHTKAFGGPQTVQVALPAGMTCDHCVLQVVEFMSSHPAPCFYHHCATLTIADDAPPPPDGGVIPGDDAGTGGGGNEATGGCCDAGGSSPATGLVGALLVGLLVLRRRR